jgi:hypothetical protein
MLQSTSDSPTRTFPIYTFSWGLVVLFGMSSEIMAGTLLSVVVCMAGFFAMIRPNNPWALLSIAVAYIAHWMIDDYRHPFVHTWFDFIGSTLIVIGLAVSFDRDAETWRQQFVRRAGPAAVVLAAVAFFYAGLAKVNVDYFSADRSCAVAFYEWQRTYPPYSWILPRGTVGDMLGMYGTVVSEILAPLLWLHHRTRKVGFFIGFLLMFLLGTNAYARYYVFTGPFIAHLVLGFDWRRTVEFLETRVFADRRVVTVLSVLLAFALVTAMTVGATREGLITRHLLARTTFVVFAGFVTVGVLLAEPIRFGLVWKAKWNHQLAWSVVVFVFFFELLPYFGLRSSRNFTMAANFLIDDGYSNHLVVQRALPFPLDKAAFAETFGLRHGHSRERKIKCGKKRVKPHQRNHPPEERTTKR